MTGDVSSNTQLIGNNKMTPQNIITTDGLEPIIDELIKLHSLAEAGYTVDTVSKFVYEENAKEMGKFLQQLVHSTDGDIRMHLIIS